MSETFSIGDTLCGKIHLFQYSNLPKHIILPLIGERIDPISTDPHPLGPFITSREALRSSP
jgi:hypothetical protein